MLYNWRIAAARPDTGTPAPKAPAHARELVFRDERATTDRLGSIAEALAIAPTSWLASVMGQPSSWGPVPYSEYQLVWSGNAQRLAGYLLNVGIPSVPGSRRVAAPVATTRPS